jgi:hypothetical protein
MRLASLNKFKSGGRSVLVATDVASRGLDIPLVDLVIVRPPHLVSLVKRPMLISRTTTCPPTRKIMSIESDVPLEQVEPVNQSLWSRNTMSRSYNV